MKALDLSPLREKPICPIMAVVAYTSRELLYLFTTWSPR
jgi:hypothetical protein